MELTDTQQAILALIGERIATEGVPPSQTEIARAFGFHGVRGAQYHLEALEAAGVIQRVPGRARGIRLVQPMPEHPDHEPAAGNQDAIDAEEAVRLPVLGQVAAGAPIGADIGSEAYVVLDRVFFSPAPDYLLKVKGDSMRDEGIFDGDLIGVHRTRDVCCHAIPITPRLKCCPTRTSRSKDFTAVLCGPIDECAVTSGISPHPQAA
jgi:repressor LexA